MKDPEERSIQAELDKISKTIETILHRIDHLDPAKQQDTSQSKG